MSVIIIGDPHIGAGVSIGKVGLGSNLNSRIADQFHLLDFIIDQAIDNNSTDLIITGDVFEDPKPGSQLIAMFLSWLNKCKSYNVNVHIISGNHDVLRSGNSYISPLDIIAEADLENTYIYKYVDTVIIGTTAFTMLPFRDRKSLQCNSNNEAINIIHNLIKYELAGIPITYTKVLIGHLAIENSIPIGDELSSLNNELMCPLSIFEGYNYVWMGHVHKPQVMKKNPHIAHVGSMDISNFGETEQKKILILFDSNNFETIELPTRRLKKINLIIPKDVKDTTQYVLDSLKDSYDNAILKIELTLEDKELQSVDRAEIEKALLSKGAFNVAAISQSKKNNNILKNNNVVNNTMSPLSAINTYAHAHVDEDKREKFIELSTEILKIFNEIN
jgi:exonuclease SbcD